MDDIPHAKIRPVTVFVAIECRPAAWRLTRDISSDMDAFAGQMAAMYIKVLAKYA